MYAFAIISAMVYETFKNLFMELCSAVWKEVKNLNSFAFENDLSIEEN